MLLGFKKIVLWFGCMGKMMECVLLFFIIWCFGGLSWWCDYVGRFLALVAAHTIWVLECHMLALLFLGGDRVHRTYVFL